MRAAKAVAERFGLSLAVEADTSSAEMSVLLAHQISKWYAVPGSALGLGENPYGEKTALANVAPYFWSGMVFDVTWGGMGIPPSPSSAQGPLSMEASIFKSHNRFGFSPAVVKQLLSPVLTASEVDDLVAQERKAYSLPGLSDRQKGYIGVLRSRGRFHLGATLHRLSAQSWPLLPFLERRQLQFLFNLTSAQIKHRQLEINLLRLFSPQLQEIPFDTNSFRFGRDQFKSNTRYASWHQRTMTRLKGHLLRAYWKHWKHDDPRRYYRLYDPNTPPWQAIREAVEPLRPLACDLFDRAFFQALLPPCEIPFRFDNPFMEGIPRWNLVGLLLWLEQHPATITHPTPHHA
jgi:hypothetical protein